MFSPRSSSSGGSRINARTRSPPSASGRIRSNSRCITISDPPDRFLCGLCEKLCDLGVKIRFNAETAEKDAEIAENDQANGEYLLSVLKDCGLKHRDHKAEDTELTKKISASSECFSRSLLPHQRLAYYCSARSAFAAAYY